VETVQERPDIEGDLPDDFSLDRKVTTYSCAPALEVEGEMTDGQTAGFARYQVESCTLAGNYRAEDLCVHRAKVKDVHGNSSGMAYLCNPRCR
jgi:hypothetical protein